MPQINENVPIRISDLCTEYQGTQLTHTNTNSSVECQQACKGNPSCKFFFFNAVGKYCNLKSDKEPITFNANATSGPNQC